LPPEEKSNHDADDSVAPTPGQAGSHFLCWRIAAGCDNRYGADNSVYVSRIVWETPNRAWNQQ
jgi:hypothetical protein